MAINSTGNNKNVKRLLIIGNGFDLACGLRSSFNEFIEGYFGKTNIDNLKNLISDMNSQSPSSQNDYIDNFKNFEFPVSNFWIYLLIFKNQLEKEHSLDNWANIEQIMFTFFKPHPIEKPNNFDVMRAAYSGKERQRYDQQQLDAEISPEVPLRYSKLIKNQSNNLFSKALFYLCIYGSNENIESISNKLGVNSQDIPYNAFPWSSFIYDELSDFEEKFSDYLNEQINQNPDYKNKAQSYFNMLSNNNEPFNLLSFNYTKPITQNIKAKVVRNVHGELDDHPIIGIDQSNINPNSDIIRYTKTYRIMSSKYKDNYRDLLCDKVEEIVFFGHSLGKQDFSYFNSIFDYYHIYESDVKIVFAYTIYNLKEKEKIISDNYDAVTRLLNDYGETFDNKDHGKNLMHKLLLEGRLEFREIPYLNEKKSLEK